MGDTEDATLARLDTIAASLAEVAGSIEAQRADLHAALEVLMELAAIVDRTPGSAVAVSGNGVEVGALMGATQAAWVQLEQRLEGEFADIQRQLRSLSGLTEQATATAIDAANRPVVTKAQLQRAATSLRASMRGLRRRTPS